MKRNSILIVFCCFCVFTASGAEYATDTNNDGKPDKWCSSNASGDIITTKLDLNFDGKVDYISEYYTSGKPKYEEFDYNYDLKMDTFYFYANGILERQEIDSNYDGKVDIKIFLLKGKYIAKIEKDTDFNGEYDKVIEYGK